MATTDTTDYLRSNGILGLISSHRFPVPVPVPLRRPHVPAPRPLIPAATRGGYGARYSQIPQFASSSGSREPKDSDGCKQLVNLDWMENGGMGLLRRRVVPPTGFGAQMQQFSFPVGRQPSQFTFPGADQFDSEEDFSASMQGNGQGAMDSGGYYTFPSNWAIFPSPMHAIYRTKYSWKTSTLTNCK
ncbi:uncharacterized protein LOC110437589 [Sorghum bicolor]|uniref:uncharacterized protein LOC110437589 n=1 Tax=Sorghum bicolor TaxID=4558 RepID=UPI000B425746|nr:uncharacterized protein LOC110437589 [Sorghum bicolor]|eukprot:XP_021321740.1 uncharacterized protein LOC110437589 [Sorghum bicolor]